MSARDLLQALRDGQTPSSEDVHRFALGLGNGSISDAQAGAFAMGVCQQGLSTDARVALTLGMRDSGQSLQWDLPGKVIDKHSTGGVGDAVSLILAPMLAAVGAYVPMISGRGLGHTGGTLDKLEAIPGVKTNLSEAKFREIVTRVGCAIVAATPDIAPADKRLYAVRDVTGTVRSIDLITSSILSKKLAAGLEGLVLDVKTGSGAVMQDLDDARALAKSLVATANGAACPTTALITDMNQPLLSSIGNAVEVADVMRAFDTRSGRLVDVALALGADLLSMARVFLTPVGAKAALEKVLENGSAKKRFGQMIAGQGGPVNFVDRWEDYLAIAPSYAVKADRSGYVAGIDGTKLGHITVGLGGGRLKEDDRIDHGVGLSDICALGQRVQKGQPLALVHANDDELAAEAVKQVRRAFTITDTPPDDRPLILERITA